MTKKLSKLSLKEFYEHGVSNQSSAVPTQDAREAGQGYNNSSRLADLSIDPHSTSKSYYHAQSGYAGNSGYHSAPRSNGQHYSSSYENGSSGSNDVPLVPGSGDVDYYGPNPKHAYGGLHHDNNPRGGYPPHANPYHPGRGGALAPPPLAGRAGHAGPGTAPPPAGGTAAMGNGDSYGAPPYAGPPYAAAGPSRPGPYAAPAAAGAAADDVWYPPPPPPPPRVSPRGQQLSAPAAQGAQGPARCPAGVPAATSSASGAAAHGHRAAAADSGYGSTVGMAVPAKQQVPEAVQQEERAEQPAGPASDGLATGVVRADGHIGGSTAVKPAALAEKPKEPTAASPFASASAAAAPAALAPAPAPTGPKNEFAERLAQRAMSHATKAKSSLLASGITLSGSSSLASAGSGSVGDAAVAVEGEQGSSGAFVKPSHPFGRPRLVLKPRTAPLADSRSTTPSHAGNSSSSPSSDSGTDAADQDSNSSGSVAGSSGRPRLQLQPRSLPLAKDTAPAANGGSIDSGRPRLSLLPRGSSTGPDRQSSLGAESNEAARKPSLFGAAKPREEVLKSRGEDPAQLDLAGSLPRSGAAPTRLSEAAVARLGAGGTLGSGRWGGSHSSVSGGDDEWQTVSGHGRKAGKGSGFDDIGSALLLGEDDPFFSSSKGGSGYVAVPAPRAFDHDIMRDGRSYGRSGGYGSYNDNGGYGSYGRRGGGWGGKGGYGGVDDDAEADADGGVFRRALPTRQAPLAL